MAWRVFYFWLRQPSVNLEKMPLLSPRRAGGRRGGGCGRSWTLQGAGFACGEVHVTGDRDRPLHKVYILPLEPRRFAGVQAGVVEQGGAI